MYYNKRDSHIMINAGGLVLHPELTDQEKQYDKATDVTWGYSV